MYGMGINDGLLVTRGGLIELITRKKGRRWSKIEGMDNTQGAISGRRARYRWQREREEEAYNRSAKFFYIDMLI